MYYDEQPHKITNNPKKRVRASQACVHCRKKKIKCDENKPDCSQCQDANVECEYTEPKKRGPRKGYVQLLEERLALMERKLMGPRAEHSSGTKDEPPHHINSPIQVYDNLDKHEDLPPMNIINHLVDLFFKYLNSIFPFALRSILKKSIEDGTVSRPLLYSVLAIGARFSDDPSIRTDPPYLAGDQFAEKALSLVDADTLQPTLENIQFWGIMSCLEYGRASGSKSWVYGGLAIRFCQELELQKEEVQSAPILTPDGSIDTAAMALRRRIYWSCYSIDKFCSAGTHRPQCIDKNDCDAHIPGIPECLILRDPLALNSEGAIISEDSLMNVATHYLRIIEHFGEVNKYMNRAKSNSASIIWPPIAEFRNLDTQLRLWKDNLPDLFHFNESNLQYHRKHASSNYINLWLSGHAIWCSSMMILHRGSLAFGDLKSTDIILSDDLYHRINASVNMCRICVETAMGVFEAIKTYCGYNTLPYLGYSAYVFSTLLMTSTFSGTPESCKKSNRGLKVLSELIDGLRPYWPICERLSIATKELLQVHQRLYQNELNVDRILLSNPYEKKVANQDSMMMNSSPIATSRSPSSPSSSSNFTLSPIQNANTPQLSTLLGTTTSSGSIVPPYQQQVQNPYRSDGMNSTSSSTNPNYYMPAPTNQPTFFNQDMINKNNANRGNEVDFNSLEFLYDTGLFGQVVFDVNNDNNNNNNNNNSNAATYPEQQSFYPTSIMTTSQQYISASSTNTTPVTTPVSSAFQTVIPQQTSQPLSYSNTKSLWS